MESNNDLGVKKAIQRRLKYELGISVKELEKLQTIHKMQYSALDTNEYGENELDYLVAYKVDEMPKLQPNLQEIFAVKYYPLS